MPLGTVAREAVGPKPYPDQCAVDRLGAHDPRLREQAQCLHTERSRGRARSTEVRLSSTRDPGLTGGVPIGVDLPAGWRKAVGSISGNRELRYSPKSWDAVGDAESGPSPGSPITASTEESLPCKDVNVSSPATFGPGQYLPAARATMYGRCIRSAAVSARAVRGMGRRRVGRSTARHTPDAALRIHVRVGKLVLKTQTEERPSALNTSGREKSLEVSRCQLGNVSSVLNWYCD